MLLENHASHQWHLETLQHLQRLSETGSSVPYLTGEVTDSRGVA